LKLSFKGKLLKSVTLRNLSSSIKDNSRESKLLINVNSKLKSVLSNKKPSVKLLQSVKHKWLNRQELRPNSKIKLQLKKPLKLS